jgi:hypothetical protein
MEKSLVKTLLWVVLKKLKWFLYFRYIQKKMASYLLDKLEALKLQKENIKAQEIILQNEIYLEMNRLKMGDTITKLRIQVGKTVKVIQVKHDYLWTVGSSGGNIVYKYSRLIH